MTNCNSDSEKVKIKNVFKIQFDNLVKNPVKKVYRNFNSEHSFNKALQSLTGGLDEFMSALGYTKVNDKNYLLEKGEGIKGNIKTFEHLVTVLKGV